MSNIPLDIELDPLDGEETVTGEVPGKNTGEETVKVPGEYSKVERFFKINFGIMKDYDDTDNIYKDDQLDTDLLTNFDEYVQYAIKQFSDARHPDDIETKTFLKKRYKIQPVQTTNMMVIMIHTMINRLIL
jgi:hypothetical protein